jgi:hypothetical protein
MWFGLELWLSWAARSGSFATRPDDTKVSGKKDVIPAIYALGELSLPWQVSAQPTQTEIKQKARQGAQKAVTKWDSLSPEQQQQLQDKWKMTAEQAQAKWNSMPPEQQQQAMAKGKSAAQKAQKNWQSLPQ